MKYIANILTDSAFDGGNLFNVVSDKDLLFKDIPTLVIGWDKTKKLYPNASIIDWHIDDDTFWTWGKRERRDRYEKNVLRFRNDALKAMVKSIRYVFLNVLTAETETIVKFLQSLSDERKKTIYIFNDVVYVYYDGNKNVIGLSLSDVDYMGNDRKEIFRYIYSGKNNRVIGVKDIPNELRFEMRNTQYVFPYLLSD